MAMENLGGSPTEGRPAVVFAGGRTHVFAIGAGGVMHHWTSLDGLGWVGPVNLPGNATLEQSHPCAIAMGSAIHVFAIGLGGPFANGGPLVRWSSADGTTFGAPVVESEPGYAIPGRGNGLTACVGSGVHVFVSTVGGFGRFWYTGSATLGRQGFYPMIGLLPRCVPAAASSGGPGHVFSVAPDGSALGWCNMGDLVWVQFALPRPTGAPPGPFVHAGFAAVSPAPGQVEVFAVTPGGLLAHWSLQYLTVLEADILPGPTLSNVSVPTAVVAGERVEVFAIGTAPQPDIHQTGGRLIRWSRRQRGPWSAAKVIDANLFAGGLGAAVAADGRIDAFGLRANGLLHWPAGVRGAPTDRWSNWAGNLQRDPTGHCRPNTEEEVVAIVRTAERVPGARVRAVGSSWSFTDITLPPPSPTPGFIVETNALNGVIRDVIDAAVLTDHWKDQARYLVHVEAGIQVERLMTTLDGMGLAPFTMGGSSGQTLAGVISTGVHGSDWDRGPIPNAVRAIQLVGPGGIRHWIEPNQWRITREDVLRQRLGPTVRIRYDDDWFDAVLVSMGSMGIITGVVLEVTDQYFLEKSISAKPWSQLRPELASGTLFADPDRYVMIAVDPGQTGDRTCYVTMHRRSDGPRYAPPGGIPDVRAAFCQLDLDQTIKALSGLAVATPMIEAALSVVTATLGAFGIPLPAGATLAVALPILIGVLKAQGPGAVGDFLGDILENHPGAAAAFATWMHQEALKPSVPPATDIAHSIMAPPDPGQCAARGPGLELAFDATTDGYLTYVDEAMKLLDQKFAQGLVLGGWFSLRFVGASRAILSPQQSARTCMIEFVALRSMKGTPSIMDELEKLGVQLGAIQHWGMFGISNLAAAQLPRAYPRLDTWRRVRREITNGGTIRTFENAFTARLGLDAPPAATPLLRQDGWRWCNQCLGMVFGAGAQGPCAAGGTHSITASGNYAFAHNAPWVPGQRGWRWCRRCTGMVLGSAAASPCAAGGAHDLSASGSYTVPRNGQSAWHYCAKCHALAFAGGGTGACPAGGSHAHPYGSYWLALAPLEVPVPAAAPSRVRRPAPSGVDGGLILAPIAEQMVILTQPPKEIAHSVPEVPGERGWRSCTKCRGLTRAGGLCTDGGAHAQDGPNLVLPLNAPTAPGQAHWRTCAKCQTLVFRAGPCFAGGDHDVSRSGDYTLRGMAQNAWRCCRHCGGLWFSGNGGLGRCPSSAGGGGHDMGIDDYLTGDMSWTG